MKNNYLILSLAPIVTCMILIGASGVVKADTANVVRVTKVGTAPDTNDGCGKHSLAINAIIFTELIDENNNFVGYARNFDVNVTTLNTSDNHYGQPGNISLKGIHQQDGNKYGNAVRSLTFSTGDSTTDQNYQKCDSERVEAANLGGKNYNRGDAQALVFQNTNDGDHWVISCGFEDNHERGFSFQGVNQPTLPDGYEPDGAGWGSRGYAEISASANVADFNTSNKDQYVILLRYKIKPIKPPDEPRGDVSSQVKCLYGAWSNTTVNCRVDRQLYAGGNPLVDFSHHFKGGWQDGIVRYDVDIAARCDQNPGWSGDQDTDGNGYSQCNDYRFRWMDADPWGSVRDTSWRYAFPPGGPYCEQMSWRARINVNGSNPPPPYWSGWTGGNVPCVNVTQWALNAATWVTANGGGVANGATLVNNQNIQFHHQVYNVGNAALDDFLNIDILGNRYSDYRTLDQYRDDWYALPASNTVTQLGRNCQHVWAAQTLYNNGAFDFGEQCVWVIDPNASVPATVEYEKGSGSFTIGGGVTVNNGGSCPSTPIRIPFSWSIGGVSSPAGTGFWYGGAYGCNPPTNVIPIPAAIIGQLNQSDPGLSGIKYCLSVNNEQQKCGEILVYEVPFARFYGNDVYATSGDIKFNSYTNNNPNNTSGNYNGQGTVAQYAALATGTSVIDTAAFRLNAAIQPIAPNGLDPNGSYLSNTSASKVYNEVVSKIPTNCGTTPSSYLLPTSSGCYRVSDDYRLTGIPRIGGSDGITCLDKQRINPLHTCGFPNNFEYITSNYDKKITLYNPDPNKPFMIVGDIVNTSASYSNPSSTGVMLIVSAGDIIIDNNVKRVDAILISNKGIYTCGWTWAPGYGSKVGQNQIDETCRSNLTINGSLSAKTIDFRRVGGSRYLSNGLGDTIDGSWNCLAWKGIKNCGDRGDMPLDTGKTAEIVNFPAYLYWATPYLLDQAKSGGTNEAMFVAPPRL